MTEYEVRLTAVLIAYVDVDSESEAREEAANLWNEAFDDSSGLVDLEFSFDGTEEVKETRPVP